EAGLEIDLARPRQASQLADIVEFLRRKAKSAHSRGAQTQDRFGRQRIFLGGVLEPIENSQGSLAVQLLIHDRADQSLERRLAVLDRIGAYAFDDRSQNRVGFF